MEALGGDTRSGRIGFGVAQRARWSFSMYTRMMQMCWRAYLYGISHGMPYVVDVALYRSPGSRGITAHYRQGTPGRPLLKMHTLSLNVLEEELSSQGPGGVRVGDVIELMMTEYERLVDRYSAHQYVEQNPLVHPLELLQDRMQWGPPLGGGMDRWPVPMYNMRVGGRAPDAFNVDGSPDWEAEALAEADVAEQLEPGEMDEEDEVAAMVAAEAEAGAADIAAYEAGYPEAGDPELGQGP